MFTDPIMQKLVHTYNPPSWVDRSDHLFEDLIETIISQQLSGKAADSIYKRFKKLFNAKSFPSPQKVLAVEQECIREIGVSWSKASYIHNVANAFVNNQIEISTIKNLNDEDIITKLTRIKGIGRWSAEMILIFTLNRPDVFSMGDLGLKKAIENLYGITKKTEILKLSQSWSPNRSLASWYLWRSLEKNIKIA